MIVNVLNDYFILLLYYFNMTHICLTAHSLPNCIHTIQTQEMNKVFQMELFSFASQAFMTTHYANLGSKSVWIIMYPSLYKLGNQIESDGREYLN